jgi:hypothetical protein
MSVEKKLYDLKILILKDPNISHSSSSELAERIHDIEIEYSKTKTKSNLESLEQDITEDKLVKFQKENYWLCRWIKFKIDVKFFLYNLKNKLIG